MPRRFSFAQALQHPAAGGIALMIATAAALTVANSGLHNWYHNVLAIHVGPLNILEWLNDGLMTFFFLLVGLEIKGEMLEGQLSTWRRRILPGAAAVGGMAVPALVYLAVNLGPTGEPHGWAISSATDIAFALGVLSLLGPRVPASLKIFLTALAIIDDLGAVVIIALFYTASLNTGVLLGAVAVVLGLFVLNRMRIMHLAPYLILGLGLWWLVLQSGLHATLAGVVLALTIPLRPREGHESPLRKLEHAMSPFVGFLVVPLFGFANAGISFAGISFKALLQPVPLGTALGLFVGKQIGVFSTAKFVVARGWAELPARANWKTLYGVATMCGIGFTMSLFIGMLAFPGQPELQDGLKLGVLTGSGISAIVGAILLNRK